MTCCCSERTPLVVLAPNNMRDWLHDCDANYDDDDATMRRAMYEHVSSEGVRDNTTLGALVGSVCVCCDGDML
jgi:hypothetical protein